MGNVYRDGDRGSESEVKRSEARKISAKGIGERAVTLTAKVNFSFLYAPPTSAESILTLKNRESIHFGYFNARLR